jgi:hypothetical protein
MKINFMRILVSLINIGVLVFIGFAIVRFFKQQKRLVKQNKDVEEKLNRTLEMLENNNKN